MSLLALSVGAAGCGPSPGSPEEEIRSLIETAEAAAEERDLRALRRLIAEDYSDRQGNDKHAIENLLHIYFLRHTNVHLITRIETVEISGTDFAEAVVFVGMAGTGGGELEADLYQLDIQFADLDDGDWQVVSAEWQRGLVRRQ